LEKTDEGNVRRAGQVEDRRRSSEAGPGRKRRGAKKQEGSISSATTRSRGKKRATSIDQTTSASVVIGSSASAASISVLGRAHTIFVEDLGRFQDTLRDPSVDQTGLDIAQLELRAILQKEQGELHALSQLIEGRRELGRRLMNNMTTKIHDLGEDSILSDVDELEVGSDCEEAGEALDDEQEADEEDEA